MTSADQLARLESRLDEAAAEVRAAEDDLVRLNPKLEDFNRRTASPKSSPNTHQERQALVEEMGALREQIQKLNQEITYINQQRRTLSA